MLTPTRATSGSETGATTGAAAGIATGAVTAGAGCWTGVATGAGCVTGISFATTVGATAGATAGAGAGGVCCTIALLRNAAVLARDGATAVREDERWDTPGAVAAIAVPAQTTDNTTIKHRKTLAKTPRFRTILSFL
ncbi:MAG: hypothetical protein LBR41_00410 [Rickettsiales bacterium]|nr:hypothetical protein [Rickettsiales bacterium]